MNTRISKRDLPKVAKCPHVDCVYNEVGICDDVRINKDNSDSFCFKISNKDLLNTIERVNP